MQLTPGMIEPAVIERVPVPIDRALIDGALIDRATIGPASIDHPPATTRQAMHDRPKCAAAGSGIGRTRRCCRHAPIETGA